MPFMDISLHWLSTYLAPAGLTADEADDLLTRAGFPIEGRTELPGGDVRLDVEVTSNRGDCLCHSRSESRSARLQLC